MPYISLNQVSRFAFADCSLNDSKMQNIQLEANAPNNGSCEVDKLLQDTQGDAGIPHEETGLTKAQEQGQAHIPLLYLGVVVILSCLEPMPSSNEY